MMVIETVAFHGGPPLSRELSGLSGLQAVSRHKAAGRSQRTLTADHCRVLCDTLE